MSDSPAPDGQSPEVERAEQMVDAMTQSVALFAFRVSHQIMKAGALAREELDDIWAEAQDMARRPRT